MEKFLNLCFIHKVYLILLFYLTIFYLRDAVDKISKYSKDVLKSKIA